MKKSKVIFLALLACAFGALAETTTSYDAELVARGWSRLNASAFGSFGDVQAVSAEKDDDGNVLWYVVTMSNGAIIVSPDDEIEPVIAVMPKSNGILAADSPLRAMLRRDLSQRLAGLNATGGGLKFLALNAAAAAEPSAESVKWNKLRANGGLLRAFALGPDGTPATIVRWLDGWNSQDKVGDVQTLRFWNQDKSVGYFTDESVFNLYTPNHVYCGCVATAGASVMHYFRVPSGNKIARVCSYNDTDVNLETKGGDYDWSVIDDLDLVRGSPIALPEDAVDLLGRVAYDCGVGCGMMYGDAGSGSYTVSLMHSFRDVFNVQNAQLVTKGGGEHGGGQSKDIGSANYANVIYNQIRGGAPVVMGIDGHEVVACGYGYDTENTDYTYVFLGWGAENDAWYALPKIDTKATAEGGWYTSTFVDELITEIAPADDKFVAVVGRLVDADGEPIAGDTITMANGEVLTTDENGYWGTRVSPADPCYVTDSIGERHEYALGEAAKTTTDGGRASAALAAAMPDAMTVELLDPSVRVGGEGGVIYGSLTSALKNVLPGQTVEILQPTVFKQSVTVSVDCVIFATNVNAAASCVTRRNGALLTIADGATVTLSNVVFSASTDALVAVEDGGCLQVGSGLDFGLDLDHAAVHTADKGGFVLLDALSCKFLLRCAGASAIGQAFGSYFCDEAVAVACAEMIVCADDFDRETRGKVGADSTLVWDHVAVPIGESAGYFVTGTDTNTYFRMEKALSSFQVAYQAGMASEFVARTNGTFALSFRGVSAVGSPLVFRGEGDVRPVLAADDAAGFEIVKDGSLTISNLVFSGYVDPDSTDYQGFVYVDGGELTLDDGATFDGIVGHVNGQSGVIDLMTGTITMLPGSLITNCVAAGVNKGGYGGAVYVNGTEKGTDCVLNLFGGTITCCRASEYGGGVYVYASETDEAMVNVKGPMSVVGNESIDGADDLCLDNIRARPFFTLVGGLEDGSAVGIRYATSVEGMPSGNEADEAFMTNAAGAVDVGAFFNDVDDTLEASAGENGLLVWVKKDTSGTCAEDVATAHVYYPDGGEAHYPDLATAFEHMVNGTVATVKMYKDGQAGEQIASDIALPARCQVTLTSRMADAYVFTRVGDVGLTVSADASLVLTNIIFDVIEHNQATKPYFAVVGGSLTLASNVCVSAGTGNTTREANGVTVSEAGSFTMLSGSKVFDCYSSWNEDKYTPDTETQHYAVGGGVLVDGGSTAYLHGGEISNCYAPHGGGLCACSGSKVYVSGDFKIDGNRWIPRSGGSGGASNLLVEDLAELYLDNVLSGSVHVAESVRWRGDTNIIAMVDSEWKWELEALANSAARFVRDINGDHGVVVTNEFEAILVWRNAVSHGVFKSEDVSSGSKVFYVLADPGAYTPITIGPLPELSAGGANLEGVETALAVSDLADSTVFAKITGAADPVGAYDDFRTWANAVGVEDVVASQYAYVSYAFGMTALLEGEPSVEIVEIGQSDGDFTLDVVVKDGGNPVEISSEKLSKMLEGSSDVGDWSNGKVELTVIDLTKATSDKVSFTVKPAVETPVVFIRIRN